MSTLWLHKCWMGHLVVYHCRIRLSCHLPMDCVVTRLSPIRVGDEEWVGGPQKKSPKESEIFLNPPTLHLRCNKQRTFTQVREHVWHKMIDIHFEEVRKTSQVNDSQGFNKFVCWQATREPNGTRKEPSRTRVYEYDYAYEIRHTRRSRTRIAHSTS